MSTEHGQFDPMHDPVSVPVVKHFYTPGCLPRWRYPRRIQSKQLATVCQLTRSVLAVCVWAVLVGCQGIFLPRIDPNGSRVFLPFPSTTAVQVPRLHSTPTQPGILPNSAFPEPAAPPPCIDADGEGGICNMFKNKLVGHIAKKHSPGACGELQLTPMKVVAPVGGEVVLLAGICGKDGYLVKREPLEWMLSPDSVGTFIEVGDDARSQVIRALRYDPKVEKLDVDFARGRTSNRETLITRGTPGKADDIKLLEGQTWLSISSPSEGVSRVTALAPDSDIWDQRRQTATIYWVDAQWEFPQPQSLNSGGAATLVTRVTKAENLKPATGWDVVYTIVDPTVAQFAPPGDMGSGRVQISGNAAIVKVDENSQATIQLTAPPGTRGTTAVVIEVFRPAEPSDNLPRLLLGRGQTFVTFSSPSLVINAQGPPTGVTGEPLVYSVSLANAGNLDAENVVLDFLVPAGMALVQAPSLQPARTTPDVLRWDQGVLAAGRQIDITLVLSAQQTGDYELRFAAQGTSSAVQGAPPLTAQTSVATRVVQPTVNIRFQPANGVAQAEAGGRIDYEIEVTNTGRQAITDTQLAIETSPGLVHLETGNTKVDQSLGLIQPGETRKLGISFLVQQEGQHTAAIRVKSGEAIIGEQKSAILGIPPAPKVPGIAVAVSFPESVTVGNTARAEITLRNTGQTTLTALRVAINSDPALRPKRVNSENLSRVRFDGQSLVWSPQDLMRGTSGDSIIQIFVDYEAVAPATQANIVAQATCTQQVQDEARAVTRIVGGNVPPSSTGPQVPRSGQLDISLVDFDDPTTIRTPIRYGLRITNGQNQPDRNIRIQLKIPQGLELQGITETLTGKQINFRRDGDILEFVETIKFLRDTDSVDYTVIIVGLVPNLYEIGAAVASDGQPSWKTTSQSTTINARQ
jgi:uncharacterized repeat protein (TIGR01451 family)